MTIQQEAHFLIDNMPDKSVEYVVELLHNMKPSFLYKEPNSSADITTSPRIGTAAGRIKYPDDLEKYDDEITELFGDKL